MKKGYLLLFVVVGIVSYLLFKPHNLTAIHLLLLNEYSPGKDARCDMKNGLVACYAANRWERNYGIVAGDDLNDFCDQYRIDLVAIREPSDNSEEQLVYKRARMYAMIYNAMVVSSVVVPKRSEFEEKNRELFFFLRRIKSIYDNKIAKEC